MPEGSGNGNGNGAGLLRQQIGETNAMVKMLLEQVKDNRSALTEQARDLKSEIRNIKHEQRQVDQLLVARLDLLDEKSRAQDVIRNDLASAREELAALKAPVVRLDRMRQRITQWGVISLALLTAVWWAIGPTVQAAVTRWLSK